MFKWLSTLLRFLEAGAMGWFLVQAARFITAWVFARTSGAEVATRLYGPSVPIATSVMFELGAMALGVLAPLPRRARTTRRCGRAGGSSYGAARG